jgi:hypothetical protein
MRNALSTGLSYRIGVDRHEGQEAAKRLQNGVPIPPQFWSQGPAIGMLAATLACRHILPCCRRKGAVDQAGVTERLWDRRSLARPARRPQFRDLCAARYSSRSPEFISGSLPATTLDASA